jgi:hypothetical protein
MQLYSVTVSPSDLGTTQKLNFKKFSRYRRK